MQLKPHMKNWTTDRQIDINMQMYLKPHKKGCGIHRYSQTPYRNLQKKKRKNLSCTKNQHS